MPAIHQVVNVCVAAVYAVQAVSASPTPPDPWDCANSICRYIPADTGKTSWSGWKGVTNLIAFGASYATTGPNILDPKPPFQGQTTCNGPNYIDFLSNGFNKSIIKTKEYAIPGSPVTWSVLDPKDPSSHGNSFEIQVNTYLGDFKNNLFPGWSAANTLYHTEFGINDINTAGSDYASLEAQIFEKYSSLFDTLYQSGARNFLVLDVPPIDRSPQAATDGPTTTELWKNSVISWNTATSNMLATLGTKYTDAIFFREGVNGLFSKVLDDVSYSSLTAGYKDTTHLCNVYANADANTPLPSENYKSPDCEYAVNEYFWLSGYHPTYPVHDLMASEIAGGLATL